MIVVDRRAGRDPERVGAAHIAQHTLTDVMGVVKSDFIVMRTALGVTPDPADGEGRVVEVVHIVVLNDVVRRMPDPDADRRRMQPAAVSDQAIAHRVMRDESFVVRRSPRVSPQVPGKA